MLRIVRSWFAADQPLPSRRVSLVWVTAYVIVLGAGWAAVQRRPLPPGMVPRGQWFSIVTRGDTVTTRKIEFPWGAQGIWTSHRSIAQHPVGGDYTMFQMTPLGNRTYCLRIASESNGCLWLYWGTDSVVITQPSDSIGWLFQALTH
jgi:hypothetical protein